MAWQYRKYGYVYILTNYSNPVLYTGVTSDLYGRVWRHRPEFFPHAFTARYNCKKLVYYGQYEEIEAAICEEKRIKGGLRQKKIALIESANPEWRDLFPDLEQ